MAITAAAMQAEFGTNPNNVQVVQHQMPLVSTIQIWYLQGNQDAVGKAGWVTTTASENAATQKSAALTALRAL